MLHRKMSFYIRDKILWNYTKQNVDLGQNWKAKKSFFVYFSELSLSKCSLHSYQRQMSSCGSTLLVTAFVSP